MTEPTIDKAIEHFTKVKTNNWQMGNFRIAKYSDLAIRALEEMKERDTNITLAANILFMLRPNWTFTGEMYSTLDAICRAIQQDKKEVTPPRTWRDVTVGEVMKRYESFGMVGALGTMKHHAREIIDKPKRLPPAHWRSLGA